MARPREISKRLGRDFFDRKTVDVARGLIGKALVRKADAKWVGGIVVEAEAYGGRGDWASHSRNGPTPRSTVMYGPPGMAYVYFCYGMHDLLNVVTEREEVPGAVLIRALEPRWGLDYMRKRRGREELEEMTSGPGKLTKALGISLAQNGTDLTVGPLGFWVVEGVRVKVDSGPRIGVSGSKGKHWRFIAADCPYVSKGGVKSEASRHI